MHRIHQQRFYSFLKHYKKNGLSVRVHGNNKQLPTSTSSPETIENVIKFIRNVAEEQALLLPGLVPGFKRTDVKLLQGVKFLFFPFFLVCLLFSPIFS